MLTLFSGSVLYVTALFSLLLLMLHTQAINPSGKTYSTALKLGWQEACMLLFALGNPFQG